jgi:hypothetical protein
MFGKYYSLESIGLGTENGERGVAEQKAEFLRIKLLTHSRSSVKVYVRRTCNKDEDPEIRGLVIGPHIVEHPSPLYVITATAGFIDNLIPLRTFECLLAILSRSPSHYLNATLLGGGERSLDVSLQNRTSRTSRTYIQRVI